MTDKIALSMIVRGDGDDAVKLRRALESVALYVDGIFITITGPKEAAEETEKVCKDFKVNVSYAACLWKADEAAVTWLTKYFGYEPHMKVGDELFLFDEARNYSFSQIPKEYTWVLWMDSDDILRRGENLKKLLPLARQNNLDAFFFNYIYQAEFDEKGEPIPVKINKL